jgi:DNA-binding CsgD family transcriptional regulator
MAAETPYGLTPCEERAVRHIVAGYTQAEAADRLFVTRSTIKNQILSAEHKMGVTNQVAMIAKWVREVEICSLTEAAYVRGLHDGLRIRRHEAGREEEIAEDQNNGAEVVRLAAWPHMPPAPGTPGL